MTTSRQMNYTSMHRLEVFVVDAHAFPIYLVALSMLRSKKDAIGVGRTSWVLYALKMAFFFVITLNINLPKKCYYMQFVWGFANKNRETPFEPSIGWVLLCLVGLVLYRELVNRRTHLCPLT